MKEEEKKQYHRHLILDKIGTEGQEKLKATKILVIGAGGLGCATLPYLVAAGIGEIGIIDDDLVEQSNLQRQVLYTHDDIGKPKATTAKLKLEKLNPFIKIESFVTRLDNKNALSLFEKYDLIVDGSDNFPTRYLINDAAVITKKPFVFGSIYKFEGQVSVFNYMGGPTYRCLFPNAPKEGESANCSEIGVLGVLPGIIGTIQANEVLKIAAQIGDVLSGKLLIFDALSLSQNILTIRHNNELQINSLEDDYNLLCNPSLKIEIEEASWAEVKTKLENFALVDVRTKAERKRFNIGGLHIPIDKIKDYFSEIPTDKTVIVYCESGNRSKKAIAHLITIGVKTKFINLKNGLIDVKT